MKQVQVAALFIILPCPLSINSKYPVFDTIKDSRVTSTQPPPILTQSEQDLDWSKTKLTDAKTLK